MAEGDEELPDIQICDGRGGVRRGIWAALDALFEELEQARQKMPEEFSLSISSDIPAAVDAAATLHLAADLFRPRERDAGEP